MSVGKYDDYWSGCTRDDSYAYSLDFTDSSAGAAANWVTVSASLQNVNNSKKSVSLHIRGNSRNYLGNRNGHLRVVVDAAMKERYGDTTGGFN